MLTLRIQFDDKPLRRCDRQKYLMRVPQLYDAMRHVALEGCELPAKNEGSSWIGSYTGTGDDLMYDYGPMLNFSYVGYTPILWNVNKFASREESSPGPNNSYYDSIYPDDSDKAELLAEIIAINFNYGDKLLEQPLSNLAKSNMSMIYTEMREKL
jgi:hypothetical protein